MRYHIIARGKIGRSPEADLVARYQTRLKGRLDVTELPEAGGRMPVPTGEARQVVLDETGISMSSEKLARTFGRWRDEGVRETRLLIGAAGGHDADTRSGADLLLAFGAATWPHLMVRAMLAEQIYRAEQILAGHPYHRAG